MKKTGIKPLDFVKVKPFTEQNHLLQIGPSIKMTENYQKRVPREIGLVTEVSRDGSMSVVWIGGSKTLRNAWWGPDELVKVDSLPNIISREMAHPLGNNQKYVDEFYPKK